MNNSTDPAAPRRGGRLTKTDRLLRVLGDRAWHPTKELVRKVGHSFAGAKFKLVAAGAQIERRRHPRKRNQHLYRLTDAPPTAP